MPWAVADVDEHRKGLTPEQQRTWVRIANGVLKRCQQRRTEPSGGCDALAIRIANARFKRG